ncbi:MAG: TIM barrel protein [Hyphomicrobiales bacterium]|nr:TIM barrel protein [Hyphomicrobiales bacterium]
MPRFAANLSMLFTQAPFLDRFALAARAGFEAVEFMFPYEHAPAEIAARLKEHRLTQALFNLPPGDYAAGERGLACKPGGRAATLESIEQALPYMRATGVERVHLMAGLGDPADARQRAAYEEAVGAAAERLRAEAIEVLIEPINPHDMPGYFLRSFDYAAHVVRTLAAPNLKLQFDIYHRQRIHGDVARGLTELFPLIGHVQIAGVPGRHEPDRGELHYPFLFAELDRLGYAGYVGCEYRPAGATLDGLQWFAPYARASGQQGG